MSRRLARTYVLQVLYSKELNPDSEPIDSVESEKLSEDDKKYASEILQCLGQNQMKIDQLISSHLKNWSLGQLNVVDKNVLRLAIAESMLDQEKDETKVIINEAIELAKTYGGENSYRFVNGLLDAILEGHS